jgi:glycosyltransferase involved in cell wall biosynthesis
MKVLFLSNFYPPASRGGYEQWCQEVLDGLRGKGHDVRVLTSDFGKKHLSVPDPAWVKRTLCLEMELASIRNAIQFFTHRKRREWKNLRHVSEFVGQFNPDIVLIWGMWNLHRSIPALIEDLMAGRVVYYMGDYWPTLPNQFQNYWNVPARSFITEIPKSLLKPVAQKIIAREARPALQLDRVIFPSAFMQDAFKQKGVEPLHTKIIYGAIDTKLYLNGHKKQSDLLSLLYIGRLSEEKGVHTAIQAVGRLVRENGFKDLKLTIVGDGEPAYKTYLYQLANQENVASFVTFLPAQPKEALPALYKQTDIFLFTSIWPEPFGRVIVEAMASGVVVVGAPVGGAREILTEDVNALTFTPNDPVCLAKRLRRLIELPELRATLSKAGREIAVREFDLQRMTREIEAYLKSVLQQ